MVCTPILDGDLGEYMSPRIGRSDIPDIREFLDNLPKKPCPSKLPEEYCKLCRRLNGEVAHYCETRELPSRPMEEILEERREFEEEEEELEEQYWRDQDTKRGKPLLSSYHQRRVLRRQEGLFRDFYLCIEDLDLLGRLRSLAQKNLRHLP
jgi:hypothetical protein